MKKLITLAMSLIFILTVTGCSATSTEADYPAAIMVDNTIYLLSSKAMPAEVDEGAILGYTNSYTDTFPESNGETNFNRELNMPYAKVEGGIAVLYKNEWYLCAPKDGAETGSSSEETSTATTDADNFTQNVADTPAAPPNQTMEDTILWLNESFFNQTETPKDRITNQFLTSIYQSPEEIDLHQLFYNGVGNADGESSLTKEELNFLESEGVDLSLDLAKITSDEMDAVLQKYTGTTLEQSKQKGLDKFYYNEDSNAYYHNVSDTNYRFVKVLSGILDEEDNLVLEYVLDENMSQRFQAILKKQDDGNYQFLANKCLLPYTFATLKDYLSCFGQDKYESDVLTLDAVDGIAYVPEHRNVISIYQSGKECGYISQADMGNTDWNVNAELSVMEMFAGASGSYELLEQTEEDHLTRYLYKGSKTPFSYGDTEWLVQAGIFENEEEACRESTESYLVQYGEEGSQYTWCIFLDKYMISDSKLDELLDAVSFAEGCCLQETYDKLNLFPTNNTGKYIAENYREDVFVSQNSESLTYELQAGDMTYRVPQGTVAKKEGDIWRLYYYSMDGEQEIGTIEVIKNEAYDKDIEDIAKEYHSKYFLSDFDSDLLTASEQGWLYEEEYFEDIYTEEQKQKLSERAEGRALADDTYTWKCTLLISKDKKDILQIKIMTNT